MSSAEVTKEKVLPHNGEWSLADIRAHLPEKDQYWSDRALRRICDAYDQLTQRLEERERERAFVETVKSLDENWVQHQRVVKSEKEANKIFDPTRFQNDDSRPPREWWLVAKPDGTGVAVFLKERTAKLYMDANDIECAEHVIEKSAYDQLTQCLEELERELAEFKQECAYIHECDLKELAEAKAALHTTRIIPGTEELHKQLTEAKAEIASQKKHYENLFDKFQATKEMQLADVRAEIERLREEIMSTPFL